MCIRDRHGYLIADGDKIPDEGKLTYRGISVSDIVAGCEKEDRFGFEEVVWLLILGKLPNRRQIDRICGLLYDNRELPEYFPEDLIIKTPSKDVMNKLARSVLGLYSYDDDPDDLSLENNMRQSISPVSYTHLGMTASTSSSFRTSSKSLSVRPSVERILMS